MPYEQDDPRFSEVVKILKGLPRIGASSTFDMDLRRRLFASGTETRHWYQNIFIPSRIIPSTVLAAAALIIFFFLNVQTPQSEDPLSMKPQLREEVLSPEPQVDQDAVSNSPAKKDLTGGISREMSITSNVGYIAKSGLNFRQVNLSESERNKIQKLKDKVRNWFKTGK